MIPCRFLLSAALAAGALAGCAANPVEALGPPISPDRAAAVCRENIVTAYTSPLSTGTLNKIGPAEALPNAVLYNLFKVNAPNTRFYRAQVQVTSKIFGPILTLDRYDVCFFEQRGNAYHFVQICHTEGLSTRMKNCNAIGLR